MFPWFGKLDAKGDIALEAANQQRQKYESEKLNLASKYSIPWIIVK